MCLYMRNDIFIFTSHRLLSRLIELLASILLPFTFKLTFLLFRCSAATIFLCSKSQIFFSMHNSRKQILTASPFSFKPSPHSVISNTIISMFSLGYSSTKTMKFSVIPKYYRVIFLLTIHFFVHV